MGNPIAEKLKNYRDENLLTNSDLSKVLGTHSSNIVKYIHSDIAMTSGFYNKLKKCLGIEVSEDTLKKYILKRLNSYGGLECLVKAYRIIKSKVLCEWMKDIKVRSGLTYRDLDEVISSANYFKYASGQAIPSYAIIRRLLDSPDLDVSIPLKVVDALFDEIQNIHDEDTLLKLMNLVCLEL